jgi:hypothetical protein
MSQTNAQKKKALAKRAKQKSKNQMMGRQSGKTLTTLKTQNSQLQSALLNMRQMYDQSVMERDALRKQLGQRDQLITAIAIEYGGSIPIEIAQLTLLEVASGKWEGYDLSGDEKEASYLITPLLAEETEEEDAVDELPVQELPDAEQADAEGE